MLVGPTFCHVGCVDQQSLKAICKIEPLYIPTRVGRLPLADLHVIYVKPRTLALSSGYSRGLSLFFSDPVHVSSLWGGEL
ncbi:hypothetical protein GDO78_018487 [Eleutherodactylus coqui]|uniref:Uncharacterized protein n=1 Tax=Eleutherodactylus coqui TaxID=57060 RepID=A0A8J6E9M6_ELECQ|nr:hypothetical protein GDO78_018487 [Eleutherodactylus coqui]